MPSEKKKKNDNFSKSCDTSPVKMRKTIKTYIALIVILKREGDKSNLFQFWSIGKEKLMKTV